MDKELMTVKLVNGEVDIEVKDMTGVEELNVLATMADALRGRADTEERVHTVQKLIALALTGHRFKMTDKGMKIIDVDELQ